MELRLVPVLLTALVAIASAVALTSAHAFENAPHRLEAGAASPNSP